MAESPFQSYTALPTVTIFQSIFNQLERPFSVTFRYQFQFNPTHHIKTSVQMWQQSCSQGQPCKIIEVHHKHVKSQWHLVQSLKRVLGDQDFYFEMRNDMYIIQVYQSKDVKCESTQYSKPAIDDGVENTDAKAATHPHHHPHPQLQGITAI